ncbi:hypothetical protein CAOG_07195 [Capsaspora owczarzaki ATCC 30864]|uniref:Thioredoxin domain-containing protein n=1 Tax=Capsaspora owczarzaki (strain ATCC 30864) TaxID=595528 RepID=A0A0D2WWM6_CAPO3|nr:hypothetical protein CAOG_07195 [Capsaspora owczarzaki ATCC 30864]KJE96953.1 hypothetical protein CAOG_007195 [Capsaspora owczarzaki ATCC 30864]|eukprot:XP_004343919.1 hypothetical protein CAOG_07195 [Capsaspora owczarzaki ATCC 30864]
MRLNPAILSLLVAAVVGLLLLAGSGAIAQPQHGHDSDGQQQHHHEHVADALIAFRGADDASGAFEDRTQATSGATTGDWLVLLASNEAIQSKHIQTLWQDVASRLWQRINVATVAADEMPETAARLQHTAGSHQVLLLRFGRAFRYRGKMEADALVDFATKHYASAAQFVIPEPPSMLHKLQHAIVTNIRIYVVEPLQHSSTSTVAIYAGVGCFAVLGLVVATCSRSASRRPHSKQH